MLQIENYQVSLSASTHRPNNTFWTWRHWQMLNFPLPELHGPALWNAFRPFPEIVPSCGSVFHTRGLTFVEKHGGKLELHQCTRKLAPQLFYFPHRLMNQNNRYLHRRGNRRRSASPTTAYPALVSPNSKKEGIPATELCRWYFSSTLDDKTVGIEDIRLQHVDIEKEQYNQIMKKIILLFSKQALPLAFAAGCFLTLENSFDSCRVRAIGCKGALIHIGATCPTETREVAEGHVST